jgi:hypothetical protein
MMKESMMIDEWINQVAAPRSFPARWAPHLVLSNCPARWA